MDIGLDAVNVLDHVAEAVSHDCCPAFASSTRVADSLLSHLEISDARQVPDALFAFVGDVLVATYPPETRNKITSMWMIRSLTRVFDACPAELRLNLLGVVQDGLCVWIGDQREVITQEEYLFNVSFNYTSAPRVTLIYCHNIDSSAVPDYACQRTDSHCFSGDA